ncbi:CE3 protein [Podospora fimiseda]|uniref:CE3 protein n=1 Tax=Podospora fimiseda TaxID=252190 RepID=A0AAN7BJ37_9PEZI|nr:CE3 protein [Podospora fimiseda]
MRLNTSITLGAASVVLLQGVLADSTLSDPSFIFNAVGSLLSKQQARGGSSDGPSPFEDGFAPDVLQEFAGFDYPGLFIDRQNGISRRRKHRPAAGHNNNQTTIDSKQAITKRAAKDFFLRVMPLGASITQGVGSTDNNGYRKLLRQQLRFKGWKVNMVGSKKNGGMADNDNQGHPGFVITEVHAEFTKSKALMPNLVLINAGTNDCAKRINTNQAGQRLSVLIDDIFSSIPGVTVVVSTLAPHRQNPSCAASVSQQYRDLVTSNKYRDSRIGLADLHSALNVEQHLTADGIHPNNEGYRVFASVWWDAISKLEDRIQSPADTGTDDARVLDPVGQRTCPKVRGVARGPVQSQIGSGKDDGNYVHSRVERGVLEDARVEKFGEAGEETAKRMFFANLVVLNGRFGRGEELDDWVRVRFEGRGQRERAKWYVRQNLGGGKFGKSVEFEVGMECGRGNFYSFGDFNNDGLDDFFCIKENAAISVSLNRGHQISTTEDGARVPIFESIGEVVPQQSGFQGADVRIADIDGDGRADYCLINNEANVLCSRNGGQDDGFFWQGFSTPTGLRGLVFDKRPNIDKAGVFFGDINGDFRSDYLHIGDTGAIETFINSRSTKDNSPGIVPDWREAGLTHPGLPVLGDVRDRIKIGRIFGSGKLDYIYLSETSRHFDVLVWENKGSGGTQRKSDGNFYCDMRGSGLDDYVWISEDGKEAEIFVNIDAPPEWGLDTKIEVNVPGPRVGMHLADWNGDGRCDILVQDKQTGALRLFENQFDPGRNLITFADRGVVTGNLCAEGWGVSIFDRGMRLADIDGDKRPDVLCLEKNGRVTGWLNRLVGLEDIGQVKFSEGWDRANMRFADVEGSGRADLIHLDKYTGEARVFKNNGYRGPGQAGGGSSVSWSGKGVLFSGVDVGANLYFTNQGGLGRADLVRVLPDNQAFTYFNECPGGAGGDDGPIVDPGLLPLSG